MANPGIDHPGSHCCRRAPIADKYFLLESGFDAKFRKTGQALDSKISIAVLDRILNDAISEQEFNHWKPLLECILDEPPCGLEPN